MIKTICHFSDLHIRLYKDHDLYRGILINMLEKFKEIKPDRICFTGDLVHYYKNRGVYTDENIDWVVYSLIDHNIPPDIEKSKNKKIGLFHGAIQGLTTDIGYKFETGFEVDKFSGCDLVLCGDIHKRQVFNIPNGKKAYMIGSTIQQNYGETINKHGYGIYNVDNDDYSFVDLENPKPFLSFRLKSYEDILNETEKLVNV